MGLHGSWKSESVLTPCWLEFMFFNLQCCLEDVDLFEAQGSRLMEANGENKCSYIMSEIIQLRGQRGRDG